MMAREECRRVAERGQVRTVPLGVFWVARQHNVGGSISNFEEYAVVVFVFARPFQMRSLRPNNLQLCGTDPRRLSCPYLRRRTVGKAAAAQFFVKCPVVIHLVGFEVASVVPEIFRPEIGADLFEPGKVILMRMADEYEIEGSNLRPGAFHRGSRSVP